VLQNFVTKCPKGFTGGRFKQHQTGRALAAAGAAVLAASAGASAR
jgi:hypothetical protein